VAGDETLTRAGPGSASARESELLLSVVVPVYNLAGSIVENVAEIRRRIVSGLGEPFELIVVSDGSADRTEEHLLEAREARLRVIHYDRNLGKGYAVKAGSLAARGRWIAFVDADLDLDPASIPTFLATARDESLDFAIGSKRHPASRVDYPRSRRVASWGYQQLVRLLFRLDVRDTQVGLKVFRREIAEEVMPLLLVKRYAFDLELLAVSASLGHGRIRELPVVLDYRFTGSGVGSRAVLRALVDTAAIFYRLRILRTYARKRRLLAAEGHVRSLAFRPLVSLVTADPAVAERLDYPRVEVVDSASLAGGEVLGLLDDGAVPAGNWLSSAVPFLENLDVAAVVTPTMAPGDGPVLARAAAAIWESRLGGGSLYFRFTPGNLRFVGDFPAGSIVVRHADYTAVGGAEVVPEQLCERLHERGRRVLYTPETVVVASRPPLVRPHFSEVVSYARARAANVRRRGVRGLRPSTIAQLALLPVLVAAVALVAAGGAGRIAGAVLLAAYAAVVLLSAAIAALRFRSAAVGLATAAFLPPTHVAYALAFARGFVRG
jgi:glycosyltransferase involved in cell wall biosynthesis